MSKTTKYLQNFIWILLAAQILLVVIIGSFFQVDDVTLTNGTYYILSEGWTMTRSDGTSEQISLPYEGESKAGEILTLEGVIPRKYEGKTIRFFTSDETLQVFMDGTPIYSFGVRDRRLFGQTPGSVENYIDLPKKFTNGKIQIVLSSPYENKAASISNIYIGNRDILIVNTLQKHLSQVFCNLVMLICGVIFMILIAIQVRGKRDTDGIEYLIAFSLLLGIYYFIQTRILSFFYGNQTLYATAAYLIIQLLPLFLVSYYKNAYFRKADRLLNALLLIGYVNAVAQLLLQVTNVMDLARMQYMTGLYLSVVLVVLIWCMIRMRSDGGQSHVYIQWEAFALVILVCMGVIDGLFCLIAREYEAGTYSRIGFTVYLLIEAFIHLRKVALGYADSVNENIRYEELEKHVQLEELHAEIGVAPDARILLMDDFEMNQKLMVGLLNQTKIRLDIVTTGKECIESAGKNKYHLIILDNQVEDMESKDILAGIREQEGSLNEKTPLVLQTNNTGAITVEWLREMGYDACLAKPVEESDLMQLLVDFIPKELMLSPEAALAREKQQTKKKQEQQDAEQEAMLAEILVVDDDAVNRKVAEKILKRRYRVTSVASGMEALEYVKEHTPDLILLDLLMPEMDGQEVLKRLKDDDATVDIPVIILTAETDQNVQVQLLKEGAVDFITKPFIAELMMQRLSRALSSETLKKDLMQDVSQKTDQLIRLTDQIMLTLAGTIDAKDKYTNGHSLRVAQYSKEMAAVLGKSKSEQEDIYKAGLLHDIGKIGVPDEIINKTTKLTDEEYAIIQSHPSIGGDILENITEMPNLKIGARWHHEKYDGTGYPDHLKGDEIPEWARIIGVADAYDAMASKRSYRDVLPQAVVREEIEKGSGTQFDPVAVEAMLQLIDADKDYDMREK